MMVGTSRMVFCAQPAAGLVNEAILVVVNAHRAEGAFAEIEDFVARGRAFAGDGGHLVVAVQMVLVSPVAKVHALEQLVGDVRDCRRRRGRSGTSPCRRRCRSARNPPGRGRASAGCTARGSRLP